MVEQLELELEYKAPDPLPSVTFFDAVLGPVVAPANIHGE